MKLFNNINNKLKKTKINQIILLLYKKIYQYNQMNLKINSNNNKNKIMT